MPKETPIPAAGPDLAAENAALKARLAVFEAAKEQAAADEILIAEKMSKGLRREQAAAVLRRQREYDDRKNKVTKKT
jgi:predicted DNA-binding WGR domain protein